MNIKNIETIKLLLEQRKQIERSIDEVQKVLDTAKDSSYRVEHFSNELAPSRLGRESIGFIIVDPKIMKPSVEAYKKQLEDKLAEIDKQLEEL